MLLEFPKRPGQAAEAQNASPDTGFAVVDVETTGLFPAHGDRVVEVAVVRVAPDGEIIDEWTTLINPGRAVAASHIHGITTADVRRAPTFANIVGELNARLAGRVLVGHNVTFDLEFLELEYARSGWAIPEVACLCTLEASWTYLPSISRRRLAACCACGLHRLRRNRARAT